MNKCGFIAILSVLLLAACAPTTRTTGASFTDPAFTPGTVRSMVVQVKGSDLGERQTMENAIVAAVTQNGVSAGRSLDLLPPTRNIGETAARRAIMNSGTDAVLVITPKQKQMDEKYIPPSYSPGHRRYSRHHSGFGDYYFEPGFIQGGYYIREPVAAYDAALYSLPHYRALWTGQFTIRGSSGAEFTTLSGQFGTELVERMANDGVIAP